MLEAVKDVRLAQQSPAPAPSGHSLSRYSEGPKVSASPRAIPFLEYFLGRKQPV